MLDACAHRSRTTSNLFAIVRIIHILALRSMHFGKCLHPMHLIRTSQSQTSSNEPRLAVHNSNP